MGYTYPDFPTLSSHKTWAEIDLAALRQNYRTLRALTCGETERRPIAVVKADAYGHGAARCVAALMDEGCDFFAVSCIEEAMAVRAVCPPERADVLLLGYTLPGEAALLAGHDIIQTVFSREYAEQLSASAAAADVRVRVHVKLDTGMNRIGFLTAPDALDGTVAAIAAIAADPHLELCGLFTHFARADEPDPAPIDAQFARYTAVVDRLAALGIDPGMRHVCNSAAACRYPQGRLDAVRLGIMLYGAPPEREFDAICPVPLTPVMRLCTSIAHLHTLAPGEAVSYGGHFTADTPRTIATLPVGYADGFIRAFGGASVAVETASGVREAPIVGNICMDQCMLDVTGLGAAVGDTVTLFGDRPERLRALAERAGTIDYEPLCLISGRVPRVFVGE